MEKTLTHCSYVTHVSLLTLFFSVAVTEAGKTGDSLAKDFFYEEYILNHKIATMKKPFIALVNGISMGGVSDFTFFSKAGG